MYTFLGYMDVYDEQYYNFYPLYEYIDNKFVAIDDAEERFPEHGNFAVYRSRYYDIEDKIMKREFCVLTLDESDIQENKNYNGDFYTSHFKIDIKDLVKNNKLHPLSKYNLYPTVIAESAVDFKNKKVIFVEDSFPINKFMTKSFLYYQGYYYGPFDTAIRDIDEKMYVNPRIEQNGYVVNKYSLDEDGENDPIIYCQFYRSDRMIDFIHLDSNFKVVTEDVMSDNDLLEAFIKALSSMHLDNSSIPINKLGEAVKTINSSPFIAVNGNEKITQARVNRLKEMISNTTDFHELMTSTTDMLAVLLNGDSNLDELVEKIVSDPELLDRFQSHKVFKSKLDEEREELERVREEKEKTVADIDEIKAGSKEDAIGEIESLKNEKIQLEAKIEEANAEFDKIVQKTKLSTDIQELQFLEEHYQKRFSVLQTEIENKVTEATDKASKIIFDEQFDKMISKTLSNALAKYERDDDETKYKNIAASIINYSDSGITEEKLIDYVISEIQLYRPKYSKNTIVNLVLCTSLGFLTIFSGAPGTGKTSICRILAHSLGLDHPIVQDTNVFTERYLLVAVGRGWNSKRDLIGYYNPLSKRIEKNNCNLYDAMKLLHFESQDSKFPMIILLDEANLSPMEYYWGDFVNICDTFNRESRNINNSINLGENEVLRIPKTLRFLATINNDHTTETISPRLIDRAFVVSLPSSSYNYNDEALKEFDGFNSPISIEKINSCLKSHRSSMEETANSIFENIKDRFRRIKQPLSPRIEEDVINYCSVAQNLLEKERSAEPSIVALDYAMCQKAITKISGNGPEYRKWLEELKTYCEGQFLTMTASQLDKIISDGDNSMQYYQFFN